MDFIRKRRLNLTLRRYVREVIGFKEENHAKLSKNDCDSLARIFQFSRPFTICEFMFRVIVGRFIW